MRHRLCPYCDRIIPSCYLFSEHKNICNNLSKRRKVIEKITFKEGQSEIFIGKNKVVKSSFDGYLDFNLVYSQDLQSGYSGKFIRVITFENKYDIEFLKGVKSDNFQDIFDFKYFENGGYSFEKKK